MLHHRNPVGFLRRLAANPSSMEVASQKNLMHLTDPLQPVLSEHTNQQKESGNMVTSPKEIAGTTYFHRIDAQDRIVEVSDNWDAFARANSAPDTCMSSNVLGTKLWGHIHDLETRYIYEILLAKIRNTGKSVSVPIRCDSPESVRHIEIRMEPLDGGSVAFACRIVALKPRACVDLISASVPRSDRLVRICSFCKQIDLGTDRWAEIETAVGQLGLFKEPVLPALTHTICPACMAIRYGDEDD
jgi:hypothetical protein